jgi:hypothetical protein
MKSTFKILKLGRKWQGCWRCVPAIERTTMASWNLAPAFKAPRGANHGPWARILRDA